MYNQGPHLAPQIRGNHEIAIIRDSWYPDHVVQDMRIYWRKYHPDPEKIIFLSNTEEIHEERLRWGMNSHYVNIGCFIDENIFMPASEPQDKMYDAVMNARFTRRDDGTEDKRHYLANKIPRLALLDPMKWSFDSASRSYYTALENCAYHNSSRLSPGEVAHILRQSHCGLIFSRIEGVCRASSEYLLCGLPVVSTPSKGGRDVWYDEDNALIVEPDEDALAAAVAELKAHPRDPWNIRRRYLEKARIFRDRFRDEVLAPVLKQHGVDLTAEDVMRTHPFPWWGESGKEFVFSPL